MQLAGNAGDWMIVTHRHRSDIERRRIVRATQTQVICEKGMRWLRSTGRIVGSDPIATAHRASTWDQERYDRLFKDWQRRKAIAALRGIDWSKCDDALLQKVIAIVEAEEAGRREWTPAECRAIAQGVQEMAARVTDRIMERRALREAQPSA